MNYAQKVAIIEKSEIYRYTEERKIYVCKLTQDINQSDQTLAPDTNHPLHPSDHAFANYLSQAHTSNI